MGENQTDQDSRRPSDDESDRAEGNALPVSGQAENAEWQLDRDLEGAEPEQDAAEHAERLEGRSKPGDPPAGLT